MNDFDALLNQVESLSAAEDAQREAGRVRAHVYNRVRRLVDTLEDKATWWGDHADLTLKSRDLTLKSRFVSDFAGLMWEAWPDLERLGLTGSWEQADPDQVTRDLTRFSTPMMSSVAWFAINHYAVGVFDLFVHGQAVTARLDRALEKVELAGLLLILVGLVKRAAEQRPWPSQQPEPVPAPSVPPSPAPSQPPRSKFTGAATPRRYSPIRIEEGGVRLWDFKSEDYGEIEGLDERPLQAVRYYVEKKYGSKETKAAAKKVLKAGINLSQELTNAESQVDGLKRFIFRPRREGQKEVTRIEVGWPDEPSNPA